MTVAVGIAYVVRFDANGLAAVSGEFSPSYLAVSLTLAAAWLAALAICGSRDRRVMGSGQAEYLRVFNATWRLFATVAIVAYLLRMEIGRGFLGFAAPTGLALLLAGRFGWRMYLTRRRAEGEYQSGIVVVGQPDKAARLIDELRRNPAAGYTVLGVCVPTGDEIPDALIRGVPVLGSLPETAAVAQRVGASAVAVTGGDAITAEAVRRLGWDLEGKGIDVALSLALIDVAGPRILMQPVSGLPLMYLDEPRFTGGRYLAKSLFDWVAALTITVVLSPILLGICVLVLLSGRGPVFFMQERIGRDGRSFRMMKFRSMVVDAHERLGEVLAAEGATGVRPYYKPRNDPRVTAVGRVLRKYSLDELPQLFNVLLGHMSLVGPRPQIRDEVALYDRAAHRRLLVKPGITGLWQVSGRSELTPQEAIRMDLSYVENWTLFGDLLILSRTVGVLFKADGAW